MGKRNKVKPTRIRGSYYLSLVGAEADEIRSLIQRRRLQILVHSCIYYDFDNNLVSDKTWERWAQELVKLQRGYPRVAERVDYHEAFKDFDGSTGFDLPHRNPEITRKAQQLLQPKGG